MESEFTLMGSYMLLDGQTYAVLKHLPDETHEREWIQTTMYIGLSSFEIKDAEGEHVSDEAIAEGLRTVSDPTRLDILRILTKREVYAKELCEQLHMSASAISKHIARLTAAGLIDCRMDSVRTYYSVNEENIKKLMDNAKVMLLGVEEEDE